jgi:hypothetical protein
MKSIKIPHFRLYKITIKDDLFGELTGEFHAKTKKLAVIEAKEFYAHENDTFEDAISIVKIVDCGISNLVRL